ncbi:MAG: hypothetical protein ACRD2S_11695, partial [Terriglobales bacterium]
RQTGTWKWNGWASDARFLYFSAEDGRIDDFIFCDGCEVRLKGKLLGGHSDKIERFEWNRGTGQILSPEDSVANSISTEFLNSSFLESFDLI